MLKSNGRLRPADNIEMSNLKGKNMYCPKCNKNYMVSNIEFANTKCESCGEQLEDLNTSNASKAVGKY
jgi:transposase-like protein